MYAKLENEQLTYAPKNYKTPTHLILNFDKNIELMEQYGFKEVVEVRPDYDYETQYLYEDNYTEDETRIYVNYVVKDIEQSNQKPTIQESTLHEPMRHEFELVKRIEELERIVEEQRMLFEQYKILDLVH